MSLCCSNQAFPSWHDGTQRYPHCVPLTFFEVASPSSSTSDSLVGADLFPKTLSKDVCFSLIIIRLQISMLKL